MKNEPHARSREPQAPLPPPVAARLDATLDKVATALLLPDPVRKVHEARKALKAYRALLRLLPTPEAKAQRRSAAAIARHLAGDRDRQAARDALALLHSRDLLAPEDHALALDLLSQGTESASDLPAHEKRLRRWLKDARKLHARVLDAQAAEVNLTAALARAYRQARRDEDFSTPEAMHELRKRVVTHRYQMSFFSDLTGKAAKRVQRAQHLRDLLGQIQDIETLKIRLEHADDLPAARREAARKACDTAQAELAAEARKAHRSLFRRPAAAFHARLKDQMAAAEREDPAPSSPEPASPAGTRDGEAGHT